MTTLSRQLEALATAPTHHLAVESKRSSLLFSAGEAAGLDTETIYKIGCSGHAQLCKLDPVFEEDSSLFSEQSMNFQRLTLTKEQNEELNQRISVFLVRLAPYLQHFASQQALEWLIYKYKIHSFNAQELIVNFIPFLESNIYGRLLHTLNFNFDTNKEWDFLKNFAKESAPVPFSALVKKCLVGKHAVISHIISHLERSLQLMGDEMEMKVPILFTFLAKLLLAVVDSAKEVNDDLLAKIVPVLANGIKSRVESLRLVSFMVICQICINAKLTDNLISSFIKLILMKLGRGSMKEGLSTVVVICQQQTISSFSHKALQKVLRKDDFLEVLSIVTELEKTSDLHKFYLPLWASLFGILAQEDSDEVVQQNACVWLSSSCARLSSPQSLIFLSHLMQFTSNGHVIPVGLHDTVRALVARYVTEFDELKKEWSARDGEALRKVIASCGLESLLHVEQPWFARTRTTSQRENNQPRTSVKGEQTLAMEASRTLSNGVLKKQKLSSNPISQVLDYVKKEKWEQVAWAVDELCSAKNAFAGELEEDMEDLIVEMIKVIVVKPKGIITSKVAEMLANASLSESFCVGMLTRRDLLATDAKKPKTTVSSCVWSSFDGESDSEWRVRLLFALQLLTITPKPPVSANIFALLFDLLHQANEGDVDVQLGTVNVLGRLLESKKATPGDLRLDVVVDTMRNTFSHHLLRDSLALLAAAARIAPSIVMTHAMTVFTFMGSGFFRKDNELTLQVVEDTLHALFAVLNKPSQRPQLLSCCRVFAASIADIPSHRRVRCARAIASAVGAQNVWMVLAVFMEGFCSKWQRPLSKEVKSVEQESYEEMSVETTSSLAPVDQLSTVLLLVRFLIRLGGDVPPSAMQKEDSLVFDRSKHSLPRLRHFRFTILGVVVRILSNKTLYDKLAPLSDSDLLETLVPVGHDLLNTSVQLDEFASRESELADPSDASTTRYWIAFSSRAEVVADRLRHLMPGPVAIQLITKILDDPDTNTQLREKSLQLANVKLMNNGCFTPDKELNASLLGTLAATLNKWIKPARTADKIILCQNAAFSLKLIAKNLPPSTEEDGVLSKTVEKCLNTLSEWSSLDDVVVCNVLLLAGELIRSHNMRSTLMSATPLTTHAIAILTDSINKHKTDVSTRGEGGRRGRIRRMSLSGRRLSGDSLVICSLTCIQRLVDQFGRFISSSLGPLFSIFARLMPRFGFSPDGESDAGSSKEGRNYIEQRLELIKKALLNLNFRLLVPHFVTAMNDVRKDDKALSALLSLLSAFFTQKNRSELLKEQKRLLEGVFIPAMQYRSIERKPEMLECVCSLERTISSCLSAYAECLTENEFRPILTSIVDWAMIGLTAGADRDARLRVPTLITIANGLYDSLNNLVLVYFGPILEATPAIMDRCYGAEVSSLLLPASNLPELHILIREMVTFIGNCVRHSTWLTSERWTLVQPCLMKELTNSRIKGHEERCLLVADVLLSACQAFPDTLADTLLAVMNTTSNTNPKIRFRVLLVLQVLVGRIGESLAPHLPLLMPYLSELLEDDNRKVEEQCEKVVRLLQSKFGEDISDGFTPS